jgi:hypothetical protein
VRFYTAPKRFEQGKKQRALQQSFFESLKKNPNFSLHFGKLQLIQRKPFLCMNELSVFQGKKIRKIWNNKEWWFSVVDIVEALTESIDAKDYWYRLKVREKESSGIELSTICRQLKLKSTDNKFYKTDCTNTEGAFRIIQSIPSKIFLL